MGAHVVQELMEKSVQQLKMFPFVLFPFASELLAVRRNILFYFIKNTLKTDMVPLITPYPRQ